MDLANSRASKAGSQVRARLFANNLKTVQALMGHSHIRTTETYLHSTDDRKVEAIESLGFAV